ncbi:MAG: type II toxin-antitoxin system VapC family toxin [Deltaproteobacteria bacterium]|nr:type II toxin-antitoxin system VapC family toxin [Deltaproteobacteria bacterium]
MGASKVVVDTDIIIDYLKKRQPGAELLKKAYLKHALSVTSITVYELLYGVQKSGKTSLINRLLMYVDVIPLDQKNAFGFYFSGQTQDLSQRQGKAGWTKRSILF